jgi:queuine tRNA-ribosyltransferase
MNFHGGIISDSGGFQINTLGSKVTDLLTPEKSIEFQVAIDTDMVIVLDDFTPTSANYEEAKKTVENTIKWAKKCKSAFTKLTANKKEKPYILGVAQGGKYQDLREYCTKELVKIGFDGIGYGGWPINELNEFDYETAQTIANNTPKDYFLYGLGVGKPHEIIKLVKMGYDIFDCVLPTRDARHKRLYVYNAKTIDEIDLDKENFYSYYVPDKQKYYHDTSSVSSACDCLLCSHYSRAYLAHLFRNNEMTAGRLATIHNLRFYSILMEKLRFKNTN